MWEWLEYSGDERSVGSLMIKMRINGAFWMIFGRVSLKKHN